MQCVDENGIPTIRRSIAMVLFGWVLLVNLFYLLPLTIWQSASWAYLGVDESGQTLASEWRQFFGVYSALRAALYLLFGAASFAFFNRRQSARKLIPIALLSMLGVSLLEAAWCLSLAEGDEGFIAETILATAASTLVAGAWTIYFLISKRVRETLVYPLSA